MQEGKGFDDRTSAPAILSSPDSTALSEAGRVGVFCTAWHAAIFDHNVL